MGLFPLTKHADGIIGLTSPTGTGAITLSGGQISDIENGQHATHLGFLQSTAIAGLADSLSNIAIGMGMFRGGRGLTSGHSE